MIRLQKGEKPKVLAENAESWTRELLDMLARDEEPTKYLLSRYAHPEIKSELLIETSKKCAYCESTFRHVTYGDIEHIVPKALAPELRFEWNNLTVACDVCNTNKSELTGFVDPYNSEPLDLFTFHGPLMWADPNHPEAELTEQRLDLNREGLVERRKERIDYLRSLVSSAVSKREDIRDAMLLQAEREVERSKPYSACGKAILEWLCKLHGLGP